MNKFLIIGYVGCVVFICCFALFIIPIAITDEIKKAAPKEHDYQLEWCANAGGVAEVQLKDRTRVDCLTSEYAIEVDFARKWAEAPFQALHYARLTGLKPGVVLICRKAKDKRYLKRLMGNLEFWKIDIKVWVIGCE